jgi:hypothetical protein
VRGRAPIELPPRQINRTTSGITPIKQIGPPARAINSPEKRAMSCMLVDAARSWGIGHRDEPHQASLLGLSACLEDSRPHLDLFENGFPDPQRLPTVPHPREIGRLVTHQMSAELRRGGKLLRHLQVACVKGQNAPTVDLY